MNSLDDGQPIPTHLQPADVVQQNQHTGAGSTSDTADSTPSGTPTTDTISTNTANGEFDASPVFGTEQMLALGEENGLVEQADGGRVAEQEDKDEPEIGPQPAMHIKEEGEVGLEHVQSQMELLENSPEAIMGANGVVSDDVQACAPDMENELKRVKVYELVGAKWVDQGTAFCFGQFSEETNEALLIARSEKNYNDVVLSTTIRSNDVYQRQQETLIVWTEPDGVDYALSFQDPEGCSEVWSFILEVQRHMNSADNISTISSPMLGPDVSVTTASIYRSGHLPEPRLGIIGEIERAIKMLARTQPMKERICEYIQQEDYIKSLIDVMATAEDLESLENLHALCSLMQTILMLNDHSMYEHILDDDLFFGVVGILEYDPDFPDHKANYRDFLNQQSNFHQPIPIRDVNIQRKIHHTYRLQFLKDVVLARALDDSTFNVLNSCIIFNQIDIIQHVQQDPEFLRDIVGLFIDDSLVHGNKKLPAQCPVLQQQPQPHLPPNQIIISLNGSHDDEMDVDPKPEDCRVSNPATRQYYQTHYSWSPPDNMTEAEINLRREVIILIQQLCVMGKNVQLPARIALFRTLVDRGVLFAVHWALSLPEKEEANKSMISAAGEVLSTLLDHDLNGVRNHCMRHVDAIMAERVAKKKHADKAESLLELLCRIMVTSRDVAIQSQVGDALKTWLELPPVQEVTSGEAGGPPKPPLRKDGDVSERFVDYFYKHCIQTLFKPLLELSEWKNVQGHILPLFREEASRFTYLADLLHLFIAQHQFHSHLFVISSNILQRVASLLKAKDKHLRHAAFRNFRLLLKQNNPTTLNHMCKLHVFKPILDLTLQESRRDNLLSCSCHEFFDSMRRDNVKDLIKFCMTHHEDEIRKLAKTPLGSQRFELFIQRHEINCQPPPPPFQGGPSERTDDPRAWAGPSRGILDAEEEDYFNADDDDDTNVISVNVSWQQQKPNTLLSSVPISGIKRKRRPGISVGKPPAPLRPLRSPGLGSLLDYDEDDDDGQSQGGGETKVMAPLPVSIPPTPHLSAASLPKQEPKPPQEQREDIQSQNPPASFSRAQSPSPTTPSSNRMSLAPMRLTEKRRRNEVDEDEQMERLRKFKRVDHGPTSKAGTVTANTGNRNKVGDDPPKKIRVKLGPASLSLGSHKQPPDPPSHKPTAAPLTSTATDGNTS